jgi:hypothetical protein
MNLFLQEDFSAPSISSLEVLKALVHVGAYPEDGYRGSMQNA